MWRAFDELSGMGEKRLWRDIGVFSFRCDPLPTTPVNLNEDVSIHGIPSLERELPPLRASGDKDGMNTRQHVAVAVNHIVHDETSPRRQLPMQESQVRQG